MANKPNASPILPPNASPIMRALSATALRARDLVFQKSIIGNDLSRIYNLNEYLEAGSSDEFKLLLPYVAWSLQIPVWRDQWSTEQKVNFIRVWLKCKARSGSKRSIIEAVKALGFTVSLIDDGPFAFKVRITESISDEDRDAIDRVIDELKPLRCGQRLEIITAFQADIKMIGTLSTVKIRRISDMAIFSQVLTDVGLAAIFGAGGERGISYDFTKIEIGSERYKPTASQTELKKKIGEAMVADSKNFIRPGPDGNMLYGTNVAVKIGADGAYDIGEIGVYIRANGKEVLFGVVSNAGKYISKKIEGEELLLSIDIFTSRDVQSVAIVGTGERLNLSVDDQYIETAADNVVLRSLIQEMNMKITQQNMAMQLLETRLSKLEHDL